MYAILVYNSPAESIEIYDQRLFIQPRTVLNKCKEILDEDFIFTDGEFYQALDSTINYIESPGGYSSILFFVKKVNFFIIIL